VKIFNPIIGFESWINKHLELEHYDLYLLISQLYSGDIKTALLYEDRQVLIIYCPSLSAQPLLAAAIFSQLVKKILPINSGKLFPLESYVADRFYQLSICRSGNSAVQGIIIKPKEVSLNNKNENQENFNFKITYAVYLSVELAAKSGQILKAYFFMPEVNLRARVISKLTIELCDSPTMTSNIKVKIYLGEVIFSLEDLLQLRPNAELEFEFPDHTACSAIALGNTELIKGKLIIPDKKIVFKVESLAGYEKNSKHLD
jgi:hypothetical protein